MAPNFGKLKGKFSHIEIHAADEMTFYTNALSLSWSNNIFAEGTFKLGVDNPNLHFLSTYLQSSVYIDGEFIDWGSPIDGEITGNIDLTDVTFTNCGNIPEDKLITSDNPFNTIMLDRTAPIRIEQASGPTANRPDNFEVGMRYFDTDLGKVIYWNGTEWVDALGNSADTTYVTDDSE
jgi:hypothetical protein